MLQRKERELTSLDITPAGASGTAPLVVMLHGWGSNEKDLAQLSGELPSWLRYVSVRAPLQLDYEMYGWFPIEFTQNGITVDHEGAHRALDRFTGWLESLLQELQPEGGKAILMGFSQGAVMSYLTAFTRPDLLQGVIALSGQLPETIMPEAPAEELLRKLPFLVLHGLFDDVLPIDRGRRANEWLQERAGALTYREYPVGHQISAEGVEEIRNWLQERAATGENR